MFRLMRVTLVVSGVGCRDVILKCNLGTWESATIKDRRYIETTAARRT
jgi:hypothetical protein